MRLSIIHETDNQLIKKFLFFFFLFPQKAVLRKTIHLLYVPCLPARLKVQEKERHQNIYIKANQSPPPASGAVGSDRLLVMPLQQGKPCSGWPAPHCSSSLCLQLVVFFFSFPVLPSLLLSPSRSFLPLDMILWLGSLRPHPSNFADGLFLPLPL